MFNLFDRRAKTAPTSYPRVAFHGIRTAQLLSSLLVGGIMSYFIWQLTHDDWKTPWTFIWLTAASLFSIASLAFTILLHCCIGLNPRLNVAINGFLLILWTLSWSLLTWYMSGTLANMCDIDHWNEDVGIMVCRIYKTLFTFTLTGFLSTTAAFVLDIVVWRKKTRLGRHTRLHDLPDHKTRPSEAWETPQPSLVPYSERRQGGYGVPDEQFEYDTGYHGGGR